MPGFYIIAKMNKYKSHIKPYMLEIEKWAGRGASEKEIAEKLGVGYSTFRKHVNTEPELSAALQRGKRRAQKVIEKALATDGCFDRPQARPAPAPVAIYMKDGGVKRPDQNGAHRGVFERNKKKIYDTQTVCGICGKPVDFSYKYPHPLSPCIDHIIPIAKGGHPSDISNLQLAHWTCNRQKSDRLAGQPCNTGRTVEVISNRILPQTIDWKNYRSES